MRGRVSGEAQVLLPLPDNFVANRRRQPVAAEAADGQVSPVGNQASHGSGDGRYLVGQRSGFGGEVFPRPVGRRVCVEGTSSLGEGFHLCHWSLGHWSLVLGHSRMTKDQGQLTSDG